MAHSKINVLCALLSFVLISGCGPVEITPPASPWGDEYTVPPSPEDPPDPGALEEVNPSRSTMTNGSMPACGTVLATFDGTPAYSNGKYTATGYSCGGSAASGLKYQCPEVVMRHFMRKWGFRWWGNAKDLLGTAPRDKTEVYYNGDKAHPPVPGDALIWTKGTYGHVALISQVTANSVSIIEQNWTGSGTATFSYQNGTIASRGNGWVPTGWVHAKANSGGGIPGTPPPPPTDPLVSKCQGYGWISTCQGAGQLLECDKAAQKARLVTCQSGCQSNPTGTPDTCKSGGTNPPPSDPLVDKCKKYTWISTCQSSGQLLECDKAAGTAKLVTCPKGCQSNPTGTPDVCKSGGTNPPPPGPVNWDCSKSAWAGGQYWTCSGDARYKCISGQPVTESCSKGCWRNSTGSNDYCVTATSGWSCSKSAWAGGQLWTCSGGQMYKCDSGGSPLVVACKDGCQSNPTGTNDRCK